MLPHERFDAWRACHELWLAIYKATLRWPPAERYVLVSQIKRATLSAPSNIAEGAAKRGPRDFARHLNIALGSLGEVAYQLRAAWDPGIIDEEEYHRLFAVQQTASLLTMRLYKAVRNAANREGSR